MPRSFSDILKDADDSSNSHYALEKLLAEILENSYYYQAHETEFAKEHIQGLMDDIEERHKARRMIKNTSD